MKKATSVQVSGSDAADGTGPSVVFSGKLSGEPSEVVFKDATMGNFTMRRLSGTVYLKGDTTYWQSVEKDDPSARGATKAANRWIAMPASAVGKDDLSKLVAKTYIGAIADPTDPKWGAIGDAGSRMTTETIDGKPTEKIVSPNGDTTVWVATDGSPHLLKVHDDAAGSDDLGQATFSRWNDTFTIPKPDDAIEGGKGTGSDDGSAATPEATT